ncbi:MAG TPA: hypothetical protein VND64_33480 [Pirellulales bacterium]|nr:hypothetical protein [Pirellulales bacterium]
MNPSHNPDPLGYLDELRESLDSLGRFPRAKQLDLSTEFQGTAYGVVSSLGFCRLYGIDVPADLATQIGQALSPDMVVTVARVLAGVLTTAIDDAESLPSRFDDAEPIEDQSICTDFLHKMMEFWAAFVVIDDEYQSHLCEGGPLGEFSATMDRVLEGFQALDDLLQQDERLRLLSVAAEIPLLENWRRMLAAPFNESPPWWLDGTLEAAAQATAREILSEDAYPFRSGVAAQSSTPCQKSFPVFGKVLAEYTDRETYATAAASNYNAIGRERVALARQAFPLEGDEDVQVKLDLDLLHTSVPVAAEISVSKSGPADKVGQYVRCELSIPGLSEPLVAELGTTAGKVWLTETELKALREHQGSIGLILLTADGTCRAVLLGRHANERTI